MDPAAVRADPDQPRENFDPAAHEALVASVAALGVLEPLLVEELPGGGYRLIAGERRLRAALAVRERDPSNPHGAEVPALVYPPGALDEAARAAVQLSENFFRRDLTPGELARGLRRVKQALEVARAEEVARARDLLPGGYDPAAPLSARERALRGVLARAGVPWPEAGWPAVFRALGMDPGDPSLARVRRILDIPDPVLDRCDALGLSRSAAAALAELRDPESALALLDAAERAGDPSVVAPAVDLLLADPSLTPQGAVDVVLAARRVAEDARRVAEAPDTGPRQLGVPRPLCPAGEFERAVAGLRTALAVLSTYRLSEYQRGSVRLLLERLAERVKD